MLACLAVDACVESAQPQKSISATLMNDFPLSLISVRCISLGRISQVQDLVVGHAKTTKKRTIKKRWVQLSSNKVFFFFLLLLSWMARHNKTEKMSASVLCTL
jgi:hypothetical protein